MHQLKVVSMQIVPLLSSVTDLAFEHGRLDLIGKNRKMAGQPLEQVPFGFVSGKITDELALGRVGPQLFQLRLIVPHSTPRRAYLSFGLVLPQPQAPCQRSLGGCANSQIGKHWLKEAAN